MACSPSSGLLLRHAEHSAGRAGAQAHPDGCPDELVPEAEAPGRHQADARPRAPGAWDASDGVRPDAGRTRRTYARHLRTRALKNRLSRHWTSGRGTHVPAGRSGCERRSYRTRRRSFVHRTRSGLRNDHARRRRLRRSRNAGGAAGRGATAGGCGLADAVTEGAAAQAALPGDRRRGGAAGRGWPDCGYAGGGWSRQAQAGFSPLAVQPPASRRRERCRSWLPEADRRGRTAASGLGRRRRNHGLRRDGGAARPSRGALRLPSAA